MVFRRNLIGETNFGSNWWNTARRRICTEIEFRVRISAKPLRSTITRLRCKEREKNSQSEEYMKWKWKTQYNNSGVGNFLELNEIVTKYIDTHNTIGNQILFIKPEQRQIKMKHEALARTLVWYLCAWPQVFSVELIHNTAPPYSTVRYCCVQLNSGSVQFNSSSI